VAAKVKGVPCVAHLGRDAAGHYVKMVHNGIEYSIMQLTTEIYEMLHKGLGLTNDELHKVFADWNAGDLQSFLIEITADIFLQKDDKTNNRLVDVILDKAGAKGTGKWTSQDAMEIGVPIPSIDMAVTMRNISALKEERVQASALYKPSEKAFPEKEEFIKQLHDAMFIGMLISYAQGLELLTKASTEWKMEIPMKEVVRVWRGGCIIRSSLLEVFASVYGRNEKISNILLDKEIADLLTGKLANLRNVVSKAALNGYAASGLMTVLSYIDAYTSDRLPTNLLQAQRDYFGAHTYERVDEPGKFHTEWGK
jgi:6-phosphogluconate dehydrogenase